MHISVESMVKDPGSYFHVFPTTVLGKRIMWQTLRNDGVPILDCFPPELEAKRNNQELTITLNNGSTYQILGADNPDRIARGPNAKGIIFSEFSVMNMEMWAVCEPQLAANKGWAIFIFTPRGKNDAYRLLNTVKDNPLWFTSILTIDDTSKDDGTPIVSKETIEELKKSGTGEAFIRQEYYCSFESPLEGAFYGHQLNMVRESGRLMPLPYNPDKPVSTAWDLGFSDLTVIWFFQEYDDRVHFIDFYANRGEYITHYLSYLKGTRYSANYGNHYAPHDIAYKHQSQTHHKTMFNTAAEHGVDFKIVKKHLKVDGIDAVSRDFNLFYFDSVRCGEAFEILGNYSRKYDLTNNVYTNEAVKNDADHYADALRMAVMGRHQYKTINNDKVIKVYTSVSEYEKKRHNSNSFDGYYSNPKKNDIIQTSNPYERLFSRDTRNKWR